MKQPELWGHLAARYQRNAPRKMLALDGGGIRGLITLQFLSKLESLLRQARHADDKFRLCDYFDYIGGTSTGAIIATCLARGMSVAEIQDFYVSTGNQMFEPAALLTRLKNFYNADPLKAKLKTFGDANLMPDNLRCLLLVVTRNVTTDSAWPISSNPEARYNNLNRPDCNLKVPLWQLVRASTAAPIFFPPETVSWDDSDPAKTFVFVDGGVTPHNNPAFLLYRMATHPAYQLNWPQGERQLQLVSIGTGAARDPTAKTSFSLTTNLTNLPNALMYGIQVDQDINCRMVGRCSFYGDLIDREVRDLTCRDLEEPCELKDWMAAPHKPLTTGLGRAFLYTRYNADLSREGLDALNLNDVDSQKIQKMDGVDQMDNLIRVGHANAESQVKLEHFGDFVNT